MSSTGEYELVDHDINKGLCLYRQVVAGKYSVQITGLVILETEYMKITHHFTDFNMAVKKFERLKNGTNI